MHSFARIFKYVKPQWPRVVVVVLAVIVIAVLFAGSFATVIPLLKVMMGQEGLHGWANRKICDWRYEVKFYVPESSDFADSNNLDIANYLLITNVDDKGKAKQSNLQIQDQIIGVNKLMPDGEKHINRFLLLKELANAPQQATITLQVRKANNSIENLTLSTGKNPWHIGSAIDTARWAISFVPESNSKKGKEKAIAFIIIFMGFVTIGRCLARFVQQYMSNKIMEVSVAGLRKDAFEHVVDMPVGFFSQKGTSDTTSRLIGDINGTGTGVKILLGKALREPMKAIACLVAAMIISWQLVLIFFLCAPFTIGLGVVLGRRMKKFTKKSLISNALMLGKLEGVIQALRVVKVYNRQNDEVESYHDINKTYLKRALRVAKVNASTNPIMEVIGMLAGSAALLVGVHWITKGNMDAPSFFGLLIFLGTAAESIRKSSDVWNKIQAANAAAERVFAVIDEPVEKENPDAKELVPLKNEIEFKDVVFTYPGSKKPVLKGVNLKVKAGHNIAVVGSNGSGKTTLINLLPRFYNTDSGKILIDGQDISKATLKSLRNQIGMVTQNVVTFNDTIAMNIAYGKPDASRKEIIDAAKRAYAHEFIEPLPNGYDTIIGEHGAGLSGGQLQRVVIARAILKNPAILIFDEATSQVDANSESKIHKAIEQIMKNRTTFLIAHRFSTVVSADVIVVMDDGKIVAQGQHEELIQSCLLYQSLYETQLIAPEKDS
ncbi:MAG: ABC transporter ATP-binding protein [Planctomycetes bacterium]|nr:ABC transporter ATP-binding protein [Planctomycetota bacterium]